MWLNDPAACAALRSANIQLELLEHAGYAAPLVGDLQRDKLARLWDRADHVPHYRDLPGWGHRDLRRLPVTEKDDVKTRPDDFTRDDLGAPLKYYESSGTGGLPTPTPRLAEDIIHNVVGVAGLWRRVLGSEPSRVVAVLPSDIVPVCDFVASTCEYLGHTLLRSYPFSVGMCDWDRLEALFASYRPRHVFAAPGVMLQWTRILKSRGRLQQTCASVDTIMLLGEVSTARPAPQALADWGADVFDASYGSTETGTIAADLRARRAAPAADRPSRRAALARRRRAGGARHERRARHHAAEQLRAAAAALRHRRSRRHRGRPCPCGLPLPLVQRARPRRRRHRAARHGRCPSTRRLDRLRRSAADRLPRPAARRRQRRAAGAGEGRRRSPTRARHGRRRRAPLRARRVWSGTTSSSSASCRRPASPAAARRAGSGPTWRWWHERPRPRRGRASGSASARCPRPTAARGSPRPTCGAATPPSAALAWLGGRPADAEAVAEYLLFAPERRRRLRLAARAAVGRVGDATTAPRACATSARPFPACRAARRLAGRGSAPVNGGFAMTPGQSADVWATYYACRLYAEVLGRPVPDAPDSLAGCAPRRHPAAAWAGRPAAAGPTCGPATTAPGPGAPPPATGAGAVGHGRPRRAGCEDRRAADGGFAFIPGAQPARGPRSGPVRALARARRPAARRRRAAHLAGRPPAAERRVRALARLRRADVWACFSVVGARAGSAAARCRRPSRRGGRALVSGCQLPGHRLHLPDRPTRPATASRPPPACCSRRRATTGSAGCRPGCARHSCRTRAASCTCPAGAPRCAAPCGRRPR